MRNVNTSEQTVYLYGLLAFHIRGAALAHSELGVHICQALPSDRGDHARPDL